jgi:hypothetical protein
VEYALPSPGGGGGGGGGPARSLHVLRLTAEWARRLQGQVLPRARANARHGYEAMERLMAGPAGGRAAQILLATSYS